MRFYSLTLRKAKKNDAHSREEEKNDAKKKKKKKNNDRIGQKYTHRQKIDRVLSKKKNFRSVLRELIRVTTPTQKCSQ